jgi:D-glycero-alpha-D-manno-heptose-7-phosphate kinase
VGCQDQLWAAYGGFNRIEFLPDESFTVQPIIMKPERREELLQSMMLFFTGFSRFASDFAHDQINSIEQSASKLWAIRSMVDRAGEILADERGSIRDLGQLLHESWQVKRELAASVSNRQIDEIYDAGRGPGAPGGQLRGAGGGGFMVFLVDPNKRECVRERLKNLIHVSIGIDCEGSRIILYQPNGF